MRGRERLIGGLLSTVAAAAAAPSRADAQELGAPATGALGAQSGPAAGAAAAAAQQPPPTPSVSSSARVEPVRIPLEAPLEFNGRFLGSISVEVDVAGAGAIDGPRLIELLRPALSPELNAAVGTRVAGRRRVELADLNGDDFRIEFDPAALTVRAEVAAAGVAQTRLSVAAREQAPDPAAFEPQEGFAAGVNVSFGQQYLHDTGDGFEPLRGTLAGFANLGGFDGVTLTAGLDYDGSAGDALRRREIRLTKDYYASAIRATAGEFTPATFGLQGGARILGIGVERAYSTIRPFQNVRPVGRQQFTLERESTVEVFINDIRSETLVLQPGRYDIADFPFASGSNRVRLVVEDAGGRGEIAAFDVFSDTALLDPGVVQFGAALGLREAGGTFDYGGGVAATAFALRGITNNLTLGAHAQATELALQAGAVSAWGTPFGFIRAELVGSRNAARGDVGAAVSIDYRGEFSLLEPNDLRVVMTGMTSTRDFQNAFIPEGQNPTIWQVAAQATWRAPLAVSVGLGYAYQRGRGPNLDNERYDLTLGRSFGRFGLNTTASRVNEGRGPEWRLAVGLSVRIASRLYGTGRYDSRRDLKEIEIARSTNGELGDVSGDLRLGEDRDARGLSGRVAYIHNRFDLTARHDRSVSLGPTGGSSAQSTWNVNTFVGYADGRIALGRQSPEGFLIASRHETLRGSRLDVKAGERVIARSGVFGPALVPIARAYGVQRFETAVDPLPPAYDLGAGAVSVFPGIGAGYHVQVGSDASRIAIGALAENGAPVALAGGTVERVGAKAGEAGRPFFTNRAGRFVADGLAPGRYRIVIGGVAKGEFTVPEKGEGMVDVGTITLQEP